MNFTTDHRLTHRLRLTNGLHSFAAAVFAVVLICLASFTAPAAAQDAGDEPVDKMKVAIKVAELQQQLSSTSVKDRDTAEAELIELGVTTLDYLDPITDETPPETVERLGRVRKALETLVVTKATQPKLITLKGNFSVKEAIEQISAKSGNKIVWPDEMEAQMQQQMIDLELEEAPFWQAMSQFEAKAKLRISSVGGTAGQLLLVPTENNPVTIPMDASGIFQISVLQVSARRNLENPELDYCGLRIRVRWEPRLAPITLAIPASSITVIDEFDDKVLLPNPTATFSASVQPEIPEVEFSIPIGLVDRQIEKISKLEATMKAVMPGRSESFEFRRIGRLEPGYRQSKAGVSVSIEGIEKNEELYGVLVKYSFDETGDALESHMSWIFENPLNLTDKDGKEYEPLAKESAGSRRGNSASIRYYFGDDPAAMTLKCETPAAIVSTEVKDTVERYPTCRREADRCEGCQRCQPSRMSALVKAGRTMALALESRCATLAPLSP